MSEPTPAATPAALTVPEQTQQRLDRVLKQLDIEQRRLRTSSLLTLFIGVLALGSLAFWLWYAYTAIQEATQPQNLVDAATHYIETSLPSARETLQAEVRTGAPLWAESLSATVRDAVPKYRHEVENHIVTQAEQLANTVVQVSEDSLRSYIRQNKDQLQGVYNDLSAGGQIGEKIIAELEQKAEEQLGESMRSNAAQLNRTLRDINSQVTTIAKGESLDEDQRVLRHALMLARRVQLMTNDQTKLQELDRVAKLATMPSAKTSAAKPATDEAAVAKTAEAAAKPVEEKKPAEEKKPEEKLTEEKPAEEKKPEAKTAEEKPATEEKATAEKKPEEKPAEEKAPEAKPE